MDRALGCEPNDWEFESPRGHQRGELAERFKALVSKTSGCYNPHRFESCTLRKSPCSLMDRALGSELSDWEFESPRGH